MLASHWMFIFADAFLEGRPLTSRKRENAREERGCWLFFLLPSWRLHVAAHVHCFALVLGCPRSAFLLSLPVMTAPLLAGTMFSLLPLTWLTHVALQSMWGKHALHACKVALLQKISRQERSLCYRKTANNRCTCKTICNPKATA